MSARWRGLAVRHRVWALPAVITGTVTVATLLVWNAVVDADPDAFARHQIPTPTTSAAPPSDTNPTFERPDIRLEATGLSIVGFGQSAQVAVRTLTDRLGTPDEDMSQSCGPESAEHSRWVRWADLTIRLSSNTFVAYTEGVHFPPGSRALDFATVLGVSPGDTVSQVTRTYGKALQLHPQHQSPGQPAWQIFTIIDDHSNDTLSGVIEKQGSSSVVSSIFAGTFC